MYTSAYDTLVRSSRPTSPSTNRRRSSMGSVGGSSRGFGQPLSVNTTNYSFSGIDKDNRLLAMERRKKEVEREQEFKLKKSDVGYAERRFENEVMQQFGGQENNLQYGPPPPDMYKNRYQKLYEVQGHSEEQPSQLTGSLLPTKWRPKQLRSFNEEDKHVVKRCIRCILESSYINNAGVFRSRLGFHRGDVRRLYEILSSDNSDWSHYDCNSNMWYIINNSMHEIANNNVCHEWSRWFGNVSRRKVEDLYIRLDGPGKILVRYNGRATELHSAIPYR
eukprot:TRINITY_DN19265_c0_g2_i1.p1 TRINITY_DN19265_c0_g2~~TRINITY_DN19265_c0_g2_i1.p1  ORF type:complete len:277 (+),score=35.74 TRINITY_DN19265_c0_g2_i1:58-888(+)